ncbi:hypothetical protein F1559_001997 [Cyanidiococcus yangmingshanensis]|uniref:Uncharacterized protein n=1 Tax=Cyanidiococcus yangmingshanensis TaxID=2690220 RepID=A0A7J7IEE9_9RHOD|nr:hypothetical protein F1559_001997 [Cyanidiococcus yangmingshanensis]
MSRSIRSVLPSTQTSSRIFGPPTKAWELSWSWQSVLLRLMSTFSYLSGRGYLAQLRSPKQVHPGGSEREDVGVKPERLLDSRATTTPSISSAAKPEQQPSSSMQSTLAGDLTEPCTELDILSSNPFTILDNYAGLISAVCFSVWHLFEHPLVSKGFRAIVWTSFVARLQEDSIFLTKRLRAQQRTGHLISPVELWRSLLALHALSVQWDCLAQLEQTKEDETASWENPESVEILPRQVNSVRAAAECSTTQLAFSADTKWPASRPRNQVTEQCTLPLASTYREFVKTLVYDYVEQYKRDIESRFTEIFQSEKEWQIVAVHIHNETDVSSTSQSTQTFLREELWQSYLEMAHKWYTIDPTDCESSLVIRVLKHDVARMRPKDLLNTIWERLQFDESLVLPDDYTFTSESVFVLECLSVLASMLYAPTNLGTDSVPGLCASAVEEIARYSMYLLAAIYAPCFVTSGILSGSMVQLEKREAMHPPLSAYQQALLDRLLSEQSAVGDAGSAVRRPRSEFHLGKFCCAIESAWTIGQVAALTLDMGVTFQERMLSIEPYESSWRYAFVQRALRMANHLRGLADALRLALYRSVAAPLMDSNSIVRNVTQTLIQKRSWWQSFAAGNANSLQGNAADETHQRTTGATRKDNATVTVTKASSYVNQITGRVRSLRQAAGIPAHAEDIFWRSCVVAALMAVQEGVGLIPAADIDIQIVSQALFDAKTLIAELEEELGFHPLPHASDLCQYIQIHLAPLPRILQWIAPRRETLSRSAVNGLVLHGVRLSTDDESAVKAFTEEAIAHLLHETLAAGNRVGDGDGVDQVSDSASNADETPVSVMSFDAI